MVVEDEDLGLLVVDDWRVGETAVCAQIDGEEQFDLVVDECLFDGGIELPVIAHRVYLVEYVLASQYFLHGICLTQMILSVQRASISKAQKMMTETCAMFVCCCNFS